MEEGPLPANATEPLLQCALLGNCSGGGGGGGGGGPAGAAAAPYRDPHLHIARNVLVTLSYLVGIAGNAAALYILRRRQRAKRPRSSSKHALMLCCLACNDLVALLGMLVQMYIRVLVPRPLYDEHAACVARVVWRLFGLGSGCVAAVMALERWLALTHPFLYQKHVTVEIILIAIFCLWGHVLVLVCLPFAGFGMYINSKGKCDRYRNATEPKDIAYAYLFFTFGTLLCLCIVWCNLAVVRALCHMDMGKWSGAGAGIGRRISRQSLGAASKCSRRSTVHRSEAATMTTRIGETAALDLSPADLADAPPALDRQSSSQRLLKASFRCSDRVSSQCTCSSCSQKPMIASGSRNNSRDKFVQSGAQQITYNVCTSEEVAFARLMTVLSIFFVVCWAPQMISIFLAQFTSHSKGAALFYAASDLLMALHFTIDPYVYVVLRNNVQNRVKLPMKLNCQRGVLVKKKSVKSLVLLPYNHEFLRHVNVQIIQDYILNNTVVTQKNQIFYYTKFFITDVLLPHIPFSNILEKMVGQHQNIQEFKLKYYFVYSCFLKCLEKAIVVMLFLFIHFDFLT
ncbi:LOW QUALITY PROTEIN: Uncharacterized protein GBIM_14024 [Gryllus bimaculatus]|nr:LOW QUALITY PROTEIN: Uncharacterized protein GBIM_14024 [Gryllus bimaculatus]